MDMYKPLNDVLRFFACSCIKYDGANLSLDWSWLKFMLYISVSTVVNVSIIYVKYHKRSFSFTFNDSIQMVYFISFFQYLFNYYCVLKYGRGIYFTYLQNFFKIDKTIGLHNYDNIKQRIKIVFIFFIVIDLLSAIFDAFVWVLNYGFIIIAPNLVCYVYCSLYTLSIIDIVSNMIRIEYRLQVIGDILDNSTYNNCLEVIEVKTKLWNLHDANHILKLHTPEKYNQKIVQITEGYFGILEQCDCMNKMFGLRVRHL